MLNAANEVAVEAFLGATPALHRDRRSVIDDTLAALPRTSGVGLDEILAADDARRGAAAAARAVMAQAA